jgi:hypothetical protein
MHDQQQKEGEAIRQLADELYRERVLRARAMTGEEKLTMAAELFRDVCDRMKIGLRMENPQADEATIQKLLVKRFNRLRQLDESSWVTTNTSPPSSTR